MWRTLQEVVRWRAGGRCCPACCWRAFGCSCSSSGDANVFQRHHISWAELLCCTNTSPPAICPVPCQQVRRGHARLLQAHVMVPCEGRSGKSEMVTQTTQVTIHVTVGSACAAGTSPGVGSADVSLFCAFLAVEEVPPPADYGNARALVQRAMGSGLFATPTTPSAVAVLPLLRSLLPETPVHVLQQVADCSVSQTV